MSFTLNVTGLQSRLNRVRAALPSVAATNLRESALLLVLDPPYADPIAEETGPGPDPDALLTEIETSGTTAAIGILTVYDWLLDPNHQHCQRCLDYAAGGPYTVDFPDRPETVDTHSSTNPCYCLFAPREPTWTETGPAVMTGMQAGIQQDLSAAWRA